MEARKKTLKRLLEELSLRGERNGDGRHTDEWRRKKGRSAPQNVNGGREFW